MSRFTLAFDAGWGGTGWAMHTGSVPIFCGWWQFGKEGRCGDLLSKLEADVRPRLPAPVAACRVVIEDCPPVYSGASRGRTATVNIDGPISAGQAKLLLAAQSMSGPSTGNQAITCHRLGMIVGAVSMWAVSTGMEEPVLISVQQWRSFWSIRGKNRNELKASAIRLVAVLFPELFRRSIASLGREAQGDVCEAVLMAGYGAK